jgi:hypothetical protein
MVSIDKVVADIVDGKIETSCCPEVSEVLKKFQKGEATIDELKNIVITKQTEIMK